jgi:4-amino-4-deoxychorismate lyase
MLMVLVNGEPADRIPADDRGFTYGDGVFRTLAMRAGTVPLWSRHYAKLAADCRALAIEPPSETALHADVQLVAGRMPDCALRITVTRGSGGRGYALPVPATPRRMVSASPLPEYPAENTIHGITVRYCALRLAAQPQLAGIKHLNRLENVLARAEWDDPAIAEGLLCDVEGSVIEGTRCNLFLAERGALVTPDLSHCGVAGVTRDAIIELAAGNDMPCRIEAISRERLEAADEVMLVNSLIGVWPVARLQGRNWARFDTAARVRQWLDALRDASV